MMSRHVGSSLSTLSNICFTCQWQLFNNATKAGLRSRFFHSTALPFKGGPRTQAKKEYNNVRPKRTPTSSSSDKKPSRMKLSGSVSRSSASSASFQHGERKKRPQPTVERYSGMNRTSFTPDASKMKARDRIEAVKKESKAREASRDSGEKRKRPPPRKFRQMKQIANLDTISLRKRLDAVETIQEYTDFKSFDFLPQILEAVQKDALKGLDVLAPTPVQRLAIPELIAPFDAKKCKEGEKFLSYLLAAETGSGKTLAYILPLLNTLKRKEIREQRDAEEETRHEEVTTKGHFYDLPSPEVAQRNPNAGRPLSLILLPTAELVEQVGRTLKTLSYIVKFRSEEIHRDIPANIIRRRLFSRPLEVIVSTPALLESIMKAEPNLLNQTLQIIVDEADSLFDRSFSPITSAIIAQAPNLQKLVLCSATIPKSLDTYLHRKYPHIHRIVTPNLHAIPRRVQLSVVEVEKDPYKGSKELACADILNSIAKDGTEPGFIKRVVVFVNERDSTEPLTKYLRAKDFEVVDINRDTKSRSALEMFTAPPVPVATAAASSQQDQNTTTATTGASAGARARSLVQVLVTTDIASRGIDTRTLNNVVLYDVPFTSIDFIHRLGRTGRMGRRGKAFVLVDRNSNKDWVREIKTAMFMGKSLL